MPVVRRRAVPLRDGDESGMSDLPSVSIDEAIAAYSGEWILLRILSYDEYHVPTRGEVIAHGSNRDIRRALAQIPPRSRRAGVQYYLFSASPRARTGAEFRAALADAATQEAVGARRER